MYGLFCLTTSLLSIVSENLHVMAFYSFLSYITVTPYITTSLGRVIEQTNNSYLLRALMNFYYVSFKDCCFDSPTRYINSVKTLTHALQDFRVLNQTICCT